MVEDLAGVYAHFGENLHKVFGNNAFNKLLEGKYAGSYLFMIIILKTAIYCALMIWAWYIFCILFIIIDVFLFEGILRKS